MDSEEQTLPAAPRHLKSAGLFHPVDSNAFSAHYAAKIHFEAVEGAPVSQLNGKRQNPAQDAGSEPAQSARKSKRSKTSERERPDAQTVKLRVALSLLIAACVSIPVLLIAVILLS
ncbi:hypothetical protein [Pseudarthrobacter sp. PS3-L1]|uniref:hypothetical protein n=1 Tax=Pseudarthrobacter sp. PS3-L1 TaxID=3046207 RepID=UPI0024B87902|nr:hypothetical protein [Pseudarthrobacter sp. PS3-L1]MDJ0321749.1 hypothetical protein [Pseudarthrobacter sp. PS3-L1]